MSQKTKKRKSAINQRNIDNEENVVLKMDIKSLNTGNLIEIVVFAEKDEESSNMLELLTDLSKNYEEATNVVFITQKDAMALLENVDFVGIPDNIENKLKAVLTQIKSFFSSGHTLTPDMYASLLKIKLISLIYKQIAANNQRKLRLKAFEEELQLLTNDCKGVDRVKSEKSHHSTSKTKLNDINTTAIKNQDENKRYKSRSDIEVSITESMDDIIFDDDIGKHIWFYIFQGIDDPEVIRCFNENLNTPISAIVGLQMDIEQLGNSFGKLELFWNKIMNYMYNSDRIESFENTVLMMYSISKDSDYEEVYQNLICILRQLWDTKLTHLYYIRNTKRVQISGKYRSIPSFCFHHYNKLLQRIPTELIDYRIVASGLFQEIAFHMDHQRNAASSDIEFSVSDLHVKEESSTKCPNPLLLSNFIVSINSSSDQTTLPKQSRKKFLIYEGNVLELIMRSYNNNSNVLFSNLTLDILKKTYPFNLIKNVIVIPDEILHQQEDTPSTSIIAENNEKCLHFMYIFLFAMRRGEEQTPSATKIEDADIFGVHTREVLRRSSQVFVNSNSNGDDTSEPSNFYRPILSSYVWREQLSSDVLLQEAAKALDEFQFVKIHYCQETEKYMLSFSDYLDEFGINVRVFDEYLPTPVCFRDFCKYLTTIKDDWLSENKPPTYYRKDEKFDCSNLASKLEYEDYKALLSSKLSFEDDFDKDASDKEEQTVSFVELLDELKHYPPNKELVKECGKVQNEDDMNVFDVGTSFISVVGAVTTFVSHDGVKFVVDNTRFIHENPKCIVRLSCNENDIVLHSNPFFVNNNYDFHINLECGGVITFFVVDTDKKNESVTTNFPEHVSQVTEKSLKATPQNLNVVMNSLKSTEVISVNRSDFAEKLEMCSSNVPNLDVGTVLRTAADTNMAKLFRIENDSEIISATKTKVKFPFTRLMERVLPPSPKICLENENPVTKKYAPSSFKKKVVCEALDFRISLPNGLYLSCISCNTENKKENFVEVKQEFLTSGDTDEDYEEEFRLFSRDGFVLIKKIDGAITILKSSGDQIFFEKPDSDNEFVVKSCLKRCHCKNSDDYKKKLISIMNKRWGKDVCTTSRTRNAKTKKGYVVNNDLLDMLKHFNIPYKKRSILRFTGHKTCLEGNTVTQKHLFATTCERDYSSEEIYFERSDGFRSLFDKEATMSVEYPDGTVITSVAHVQREVDGFQYVSLNFRYEHPKYITVCYEYDDSLIIEMSNDVHLIRNQENEYSFKIGSVIETSINMKSVSFKKKCEDCHRSYMCEFNIEPLINKNAQPNDRFIYIRDSYEKNFFADFAGNCRRDENFVNRPTNNAACNHYEKNVYGKFFVIDNNFCGEKFWTNNMIQSERHRIQKTGQVKESRDSKKRKVLRFIQNNYERISSKFFNSNCKNSLVLSKYKLQQAPEVEYYSYRVLVKMIDTEEIETIIGNLRLLLKETGLYCILQPAVGNILKDCQDLKLIKSCQLNTTESSESDDRRKCKCIVSKKSMTEKIITCRNELKKYREIMRIKEVPCYFKSQFCQILDK